MAFEKSYMFSRSFSNKICRGVAPKMRLKVKLSKYLLHLFSDYSHVEPMWLNFREEYTLDWMRLKQQQQRNNNNNDKTNNNDINASKQRNETCSYSGVYENVENWAYSQESE